VLITDNYLRRGYEQLQTQLHPDTLFFLGDLFDGGREWKTAHGEFKDASWARPHPNNEAKYVKSWNRKYGEDFWLQEYERFSGIFFKHYGEGILSKSGREGERRGRKLVASLPGNHDLGFGSMVKVPVRDRFSTYFGEPNRVDVVGNHTIVSVDTVSLSADTSEQMGQVDLKEIYGPAQEFLEGVKSEKRRAIERELNFFRGENKAQTQFNHVVDDAAAIHGDEIPQTDPGDRVADFPTILLTHVPLYRNPGTPCGPMREHYPPSKNPTKDPFGNIIDHRNAISVTAGYQYQNVLNEEDSVNLINSIGNVKHVFSGDDHDYCELRHSDAKQNVREITVKSMSMAMGVSTPGFMMVSLWNPVSMDGRPLSHNEGGPGEDATIQTHLCLLPTQFNTYFGYIYLGIVCIVVLGARAVLVPILNLQPFRLASDSGTSSSLPHHKDKLEDGDSYSSFNSGGSSGSYAHALPARTSSLGTRGRAPSTTTNGSAMAKGGSGQGLRGKRKSSKGRNAGKWGWAENTGPRIQLQTDFYDPGNSMRLWRAAGARQRMSLKGVWGEFSTSMWRVVWMAGLVWLWLNYRG